MAGSHLTRGAWIEISLRQEAKNEHKSRTSHEVRGLKLRKLELVCVPLNCRTSHEVRGLKYIQPLRL